MLSNKEYKKIMDYKKEFLYNSPIILPCKSDYLDSKIKSLDSEDLFILDITRGNLKLNKISYQTRHPLSETILLRIDTKGPRHKNPNDDCIEGPHIHIYIDEYENKWAIPLDNNMAEYIDKIISYTNIDSLCFLKKLGGPYKCEQINNLNSLLIYFLNCFNVNNIPHIIDREKSP